MIVLILSIGQLIGSDLGVLKAGFQKWFSEQGRDVTGDQVWDWMSKNLKPLRTNEITIEELCNRFNAQFNSPSVEQPEHLVEQMPHAVFIDIFKRMATVDVRSLQDITEFARYLNRHQGGIKTILVSHTNLCQFNHILSQLGDLDYSILDGEVLGIPDENLLFTTSMHSKAELHPDSLTYALRVLGLTLDDPQVHYISLLNTIQGSEFVKYINPYRENEKKLDMPHLLKIIGTEYTEVQETTAKIIGEEVPPQVLSSRDDVLRIIQEFEDHVGEFYKGVPPKGTLEFCEAARQICQSTPLESGENAQSNFNGSVCRRLSRLANQTFHHRDYMLRFIADIIFIPLGYITFGAAFALKTTLTDSSTFLGAKTHRLEKMEELIGEIVDDVRFMQP